MFTQSLRQISGASISKGNLLKIQIQMEIQMETIQMETINETHSILLNDYHELHF